MNSALVETQTFNKRLAPTAVCVELPVPPTHPYLVTGVANSMLWIEGARQGVVRVGLQNVAFDLDASILHAVLTRGAGDAWDNVLPMFRDWEAKALAHFAANEFTAEEIEVLGHNPVKTQLTSHWNFPWIPPGVLIVVVKDRSYLGSAYQYADGRSAVLVHNPTRAMVVFTAANVEALPDVVTPKRLSKP